MTRTTLSTRHCPHEDCRSNRERLNPRLTRHSGFATRRGLRRRLRCKHCGRTFATTRGTVYFRLRRAKAVVDRVHRALVDGVSPAVVARTEQLSPGTVSRWRARAARHAWRFTDEHLRLDKPVELQFDELKGYGASAEADTWGYNSLEVGTRTWTSWRVARRTLRSTRIATREARDRMRTAREAVLCTSDERKYQGPSSRRTFATLGVHVQVDSRAQVRGRALRRRARSSEAM